VFVISESWLWKNISDDEVQIPGYQMLRADRPNIKTYNKRGGGVLTYVKEEYTIIKQNNSFSHSVKVQSIQFTISKQYIKPILIMALYRVSDTPARFIDELENEININREREIYVIGDLNINQLSFKENVLRPLLQRTSMKQLINQPTRITEESRSLIDVIITTNPECNKVSGVLRCAAPSSTMTSYTLFENIENYLVHDSRPELYGILRTLTTKLSSKCFTQHHGGQ
jgi:hypothetical protein